jgi:hypothetical protein
VSDLIKQVDGRQDGALSAEKSSYEPIQSVHPLWVLEEASVARLAFFNIYSTELIGNYQKERNKSKYYDYEPQLFQGRLLL